MKEVNDKQRARLDRLTLANIKLQKKNAEIRKEVELARQALQDIKDRARQRTIRQKTREQLQDIGVLIVPKTD